MPLEGVDAGMSKAYVLMERTWQQAAGALELACSPVLTDSVGQCPYKKGTLIGSARIDVYYSEDFINCIIGYHTRYALRQHEELTWKHAEGRKAKYLEDPARQQAPKIQARFIQSMKSVFGKGFANVG
jgi:hypothetical protein